MKDLVRVEQLPLIPKNWDYEASVVFLKPKILNWKRETYEIACELHIANEVLAKHSGRPPKFVPDGTNYSFEQYCNDVGIPKRTAYRWMAMVFGSKQLPSPPLPKLESQVLYADPPWAFNNSGFDQSAAQQYPVLSADAIGSFTDQEGKTIKRLASEKRSVLFLWVPEALLPEGLEVTKAWGFQYKAQMVWVKDKSPGMGWWVNSRHELLCIGSKGDELHPAIKYDSVFEAPITRHSEKPEKVYEMIEAMYTGPYIELFARKRRKGWKVWGNQLPPPGQ